MQKTFFFVGKFYNKLPHTETCNHYSLQVSVEEFIINKSNSKCRKFASSGGEKAK